METNNFEKKDFNNVLVETVLVMPNREQPREEFDETSLKELAESIKNFGIISPIIVREIDGFYQIIAGERRWRAARIAGLDRVPVIIREFDDKTVDEIAILENIQRKDLNPIEEAKAYKKLIEKYSMTQEEIASRLSINRMVIATSLRLLKLESKVQELLLSKKITVGHAKALAGIKDKRFQVELAMRIVLENLTVREVEKIISELGNKKKKLKKQNFDDKMNLIFEDLANKTIEALGTRVIINRKSKDNGEIKISYSSLEELEMITDRLRRG